MLTREMTEKLNDQMNLESYSAHLYLQMSAWCYDKQFSTFAKFLRDHAKEEQQHMERLFDYIIDCDQLSVLQQISAPSSSYDSLHDVFQQAYEHELKISKAINDLVDYALTNKDYSTFQFLQWYVSEQHEEEKLFKTILDKVKLVGSNKRDLFFMDKDFDQVLSESRVLPNDKK